MEGKIHTWLENGFFGLGSLVLLYCADQIGSLNKSVSDLNLKLTAYMARLDNQDTSLKDHESRLRILEKR